MCFLLKIYENKEEEKYKKESILRLHPDEASTFFSRLRVAVARILSLAHAHFLMRIHAAEVAVQAAVPVDLQMQVRARARAQTCGRLDLHLVAGEGVGGCNVLATHVQEHRPVGMKRDGSLFIG